MSLHRHILGRIGQPLPGPFPAAPLGDALIAAGYPLPVRTDDGRTVGRLFNLREVDENIEVTVEWFVNPGGRVKLEAQFADADMQLRDGALTLTAGTVSALRAAALLGDRRTETDVPADTPPDAPADTPAGSDGTITVDVDLPVAPMDTPYDAHTAVGRIAAYLGDSDRLGDAFLYQDPGTAGTSVDDYQFPVADVIDGQLMLVPQAVADAASIIDGGDATADLSQTDLDALSDVLDELYLKVSAGVEGRYTGDGGGGCDSCGDPDGLIVAGSAVTAAATEDLPIAPDDTPWDGAGAESRVLKFATEANGEVNGHTLGSAYLFQVPQSDPKLQSSYKLPVADVINGKLTIVPNAVRAASAALGGARGGVKGMTPAQRKTAQAAASALMSRIRAKKKGATQPEPVAASATATVAPISAWMRHHNPPDEFFAPMQLRGPTPITVTAAGEVYGHVADWRQCHTSFTSAGVCVEVPRSRCDYCKFHSGSVVTASGAQLRTGSLCVGGGHAPLDGPGAEIAAATAHYDRATAVAKGVMRDDEWGPYFHGALTPQATDNDVYAVMAYPPSGDWRPVSPRGPLEMIAVTAVATPGFPVSSVTASADGDITAAIITHCSPYDDEPSTQRETVGSVGDELAALRAAAIEVLAASIGRTRGDELAALSAAVHG